jgi:phosphoribosylaminoimidazolecarboxamide formyltransferase/IMP cyclohydrolase
MNQYAQILEILNIGGASSTIEQRKKFAANAFNVSSHYDTIIFNYFNDNTSSFKHSIRESKDLRYGENPHQSGTFYGNLDEIFTKLNGKDLSYNNLLDIDAAVSLISEFDDCTFAVLKHNNTCGIASRPKIVDAFKDALAGDPVSAFGGVLISNSEVDLDTAEEINNLFYEVLIAPSFNSEALNLLKQKKNRVILKQNKFITSKSQFRTILNGVLFQDKNLTTDKASSMKNVTKIAPNKKQKTDLIFASKVCKHTKSNTIVFAKDKQLLSSGVGQTSRIDALKQAVEKAAHFGFNLKGSVMASDAFFPFPDCVELAEKAGVSAVIQPGGSIKDQLSIDYCDSKNMTMVLTGIRHFKH